MLGILCSLCTINHSTNMEEGILKIKVLKLGGFPSTGSSITHNKINILAISLLLWAPATAQFANKLCLCFKGFSEEEYLCKHWAFPSYIKDSNMSQLFHFLFSSPQCPCYYIDELPGLMFLFIRTQGHWGDFNSEWVSVSFNP